MRKDVSGNRAEERLELVLKTDSVGTEEAVISSLQAVNRPNVTIEIIHAATGDISKSDLFMAETGSRLVVGFNVDILPKIKEQAAEQHIEVRLYDVIYKLVQDLMEIAASLTRQKEEEKITGRARVIALFTGGRKGIILGCEVLYGSLALGKKIRVISEPGTVYEGTIDSLHIEKSAVKQATVGQQVGLKIAGFKRGKKGDIIECFETVPSKLHRWQPRGGVFNLQSGE